MKKILLLSLAIGLASGEASFAQGPLKIGTVDMQRAFKEYNKTKDAETKINDAKNAAKKEYDERAEKSLLSFPFSSFSLLTQFSAFALSGG